MAEPAEKLPTTVAEFLKWAQGRPGRYELHDGHVVAMTPQRAIHARTKHRVARALEDAVEAAGLPCEVYPDGMTVRIDRSTAFEPDALLRCGEPLHADAITVEDPLLVVEVVSPSNEASDTGHKLAGYFRVPGLRHYLIVDPLGRVVIHHERTEGEEIRTRILTKGILRLAPPGIEVELEELFPKPCREG